MSQPLHAAYPQRGLQVAAPRVQRHLQTLGVLWCAFGAYRIISGLVAMFVLRVFTLKNFGSEGWMFGNSMGSAWISSLLPIIAIYTIVVSALALIVGYSLLTRRRWGRTLAIVVGVLTLLRPLLGTILGIYTLWALAPAASGEEYEATADRS